MMQLFAGDTFRLPLKRSAFVLLAGLLLTASIMPILINNKATALSPITARRITLGSSEVGQTDVTYTANFTTGEISAFEAIVIDFCSDSPLIGAACTAPTGFDVNETNLAFSVSGHAGATAFTKHANTDTNTLILSRSDATTTAASTAITVTLGAGAGNDGITNPTTACDGSSATVCTFYARILIYATAADGEDYASNDPDARTNEGAVALSTANQLTINARVQEVLHFCVGTDDSGTNSDCRDLSGTTVDLGVVDSAGSSVSPVNVNGGNNRNGLAMIRTNAAGGADVTYFAEQAAGSGTLKVATATCGGDTSYATGTKTDQCFNGTNTQTAFNTANFEGFGLTVSSVDTSNGGATTNVTRNAEYDGDATEAQGFAWNSSTTATSIASSTGGAAPENRVIDDELLVLRFAARAATTTPTGSYTVTSTYIATATY